MIVTFEGGEGAGKSTQAARLCSHIESKGLPWLSLREPGGSRFSEDIRSLFFREGLDAMTELLLILSSRRQNIKEIIEPALEKGKIVIIDRFVHSTLVYQGVACGLGMEQVREIMKMTGTWIEPDLTFIMDIDPVLALRRIDPGDKFECRNLEFHNTLRKAFLEIANDSRYRIIDTNRDSEIVTGEIRSIFDEFIAGMHALM